MVSPQGGDLIGGEIDPTGPLVVHDDALQAGPRSERDREVALALFGARGENACITPEDIRLHRALPLRAGPI